MLKRLLTVLLALGGLLPPPAGAQTIPPLPAPAPATLQGEELRTWLRQNWYAPYRVVLEYGPARGRLYNYIDNQDNKVTCVYSGYAETVPFNPTSTNTNVFSDGDIINCEHTIPQSWFNEKLELKTDLHHLYPTYKQWNSNRGADPFADIPDASTQGWLRGTTRLTTVPASNIDEYSEDTGTQFEPREDHKGNLARTAFYFYTMHVSAADFDPGKGVITALADLPTLYRWHLADPVDERERERNRRTAAAQGNYNPYIADPALVARAWNLAAPGPTIFFSAATASVAEGNAGPSTYTATLSVSPTPTAALSVQVALDAASSTASAGSDFSFSSPQTVTFAAGQSTVTVAVTINGDLQPEADETLTLTLQNPGAGGAIGGPASQVITITNDDGPAPTVSFAAAAGSVAEGNSGPTTYRVQVNFTGPPPAASFTVPVTVEAGSTATSPADYTLSPATLTFGGAVTQQTVTITVNGDLTPEAPETLRLRLGAASDAAVVIGTPSRHVLTIANDDQAPQGGLCSALFFSEYAESAGGNTKVLEIYNPTNASLDLAGVRVELFANGSSTATATQALSGTVAPGGVFVVANTGVTDAGVKALNPLESSVAFFNGDDALALFDGTDTLDIIGVIGQRPASGFLVPGGSAVDNTLRRRPETGRGSTRWVSDGGAATWQAAGPNVFTDLGRHRSTACLVGTATKSGAALRAALELFPNPAAETLRLRLPGAGGTQAATIELLDNVSRVVRVRTATLGTTAAAQLDLRGLPAGLYVVRVRTAAGLYAGRLVIN